MTVSPRPIQSSRLLVLCIRHPDLYLKGTQRRNTTMALGRRVVVSGWA